MVSVFIVAASMKKGDEAAVVRCYSQKLSDLLYENFIYTQILQRRKRHFTVHVCLTVTSALTSSTS
jgi:hypothetical protein